MYRITSTLLMVSLALLPGFTWAQQKAAPSCFAIWLAPTCSDKDPKVGRSCAASKASYESCLKERRAQREQKQREREALERSKKKAEYDAVETANRAAKELRKLNGQGNQSGGKSSSTPGRVTEKPAKDENERKGF